MHHLVALSMLVLAALPAPAAGATFVNNCEYRVYLAPYAEPPPGSVIGARLALPDGTQLVSALLPPTAGCAAPPAFSGPEAR